MFEMTIARPQTWFAVALGLFICGFNTASANAEDKPAHAHAVGHDHDAMKLEQKIGETLATLATADAKQAVAQRFCPVMEYSRLGADGAPHKVMIGGTPVFVCCEECIKDAQAGGKKTLVKAEMLTKVSASMKKMPIKERTAAEAQKYCAIANKNLLGLMGTPVMLELEGKPVFLCCKGCVAKANANPAATLAKVEDLKKAGEREGHEHGGHDDKGHDPGEHKN